MKKVIALALSLALIMCTFASSAFASSKVQLLQLKNHLEDTIPDELIWETDTYKYSDLITFSYWMIDEEDGEYVGVTIESDLLDACLLDYINQTEDSNTAIKIFLEIMLGIAGKYAKQAKACGITDTNFIYYYESSKSNVGAELMYAIIVNVDNDKIQVAQDDILNATGTISLFDHIDENYYFDTSSFSN